MNAVLDILQFIYHSLVFPGLLFVSIVGLLYVGIDRKVTGHLQHRIGPPIWQEFLDFGKLMTKEDITPAAAIKPVFVAAPLLALGSLAAVMLLLPVNSPQPTLQLTADLIVIIYLLNIPAIFMILGGYSSGSPFAIAGAGRYIVQLLGYEFVFILSIAAIAIKVGTLNLTDIIKYQGKSGWLLFDWKLVPAIVAMLIAAQGKLLRTPFDIPEAETEIVAGPLTEYSGPKLAIWRTAYNVETIAVAALLTSLFLGGPTAYIIGGVQIPAIVDFLIKTFLIVMLTTLVRNIVARVRIDQALKFYWTFGILLAAISLILVMVVP
ncbi:MAG: complex I subunit 1 family protein [Candidatus Hadarchaeum sp.]|uniref:complex I subunit 1 family protein n=1 Tax=Candidatus Hadarchaeum sp. TaxID=2883567 RepID=UPI003D131BDF